MSLLLKCLLLCFLIFWRHVVTTLLCILYWWKWTKFFKAIDLTACLQTYLKHLHSGVHLKINIKTFRIFMSFDRNVMTENVAKVNFQHAPLSGQLRFHPLLPQRRYPVPDKKKKNNPSHCINTTVQQCTACLRWFWLRRSGCFKAAPSIQTLTDTRGFH